eukprot:g2250.t1
MDIRGFFDEGSEDAAKRKGVMKEEREDAPKRAKIKEEKEEKQQQASGLGAAAAGGVAGAVGVKRARSDSPGGNTKRVVVPTGQKDCLSEMSFAVTGVFATISREEVEDLVRRYDGRLKTSVGSRTDYLVAGDKLEDDRPVEQGSKRKAQKEGTEWC